MYKIPLSITGATSISLSDSNSFRPDRGDIETSQFNFPLEANNDMRFPSSLGTYMLLFRMPIDPDPFILRGTFRPLYIPVSYTHLTLPTKA